MRKPKETLNLGSSGLGVRHRAMALFLMLQFAFPLLASAQVSKVVAEQERLVSTNLFRLRNREASQNSTFGIAQLNQKAIRDLNGLQVPNRKVGRVVSVDPDTAREMLESIELHPIVSHYALSSYNVKGDGIGFCFGRAMYAHLLALDLGMQKEAIKKAFVVGPMRTGSMTWSFHVATLVKSGDEWLALDSVPGKTPLKVQEWFDYFKRQSTDKKLRIYITEPEKFTAESATYSQIQLGLNLSREEDWYSGYFKDLTSWFASQPKYSKLDLDSPAEFKLRLTTNEYKSTPKSFFSSCMSVLSR
jgi:hypothetical protein